MSEPRHISMAEQACIDSGLPYERTANGGFVTYSPRTDGRDPLGEILLRRLNERRAREAAAAEREEAA